MNKLSQTERDLGGVRVRADTLLQRTGQNVTSINTLENYAQGQNTLPIREEGEMGSMPLDRL
jgi:hypothetical protein